MCKSWAFEHGVCGTWCTHSHWKGWRLANLYLHHLMHICKEGEDGLGWFLLRTWIEQNDSKMRNQRGYKFPWILHDSWMVQLLTHRFVFIFFLWFMNFNGAHTNVRWLFYCRLCKKPRKNLCQPQCVSKWIITMSTHTNMWQMQHTTIKYHQEHGMGDANYSSKEGFPSGKV